MFALENVLSCDAINERKSEPTVKKQTNLTYMF